MDEKLDGCSGYCLIHDTETEFTSPKDVQGALFTCQACKEHIETDNKGQHIFEPSWQLLGRIRRYPKNQITDLDAYTALLNKMGIRFDVRIERNNQTNDKYVQVYYGGTYAGVYANFNLDGNIIHLEAMS